MPAHVTCRECGERFTPPANRRGARPKFCAPEHAKAFNNRRMRRGAEVYDLFRAMRRDRKAAAALGVWNAMCRLDLVWQEEDEAAGRKVRSFLPPAEALENLFTVRDRVPAKNLYVRPNGKTG